MAFPPGGQPAEIVQEEMPWIAADLSPPVR